MSLIRDIMVFVTLKEQKKSGEFSKVSPDNQEAREQLPPPNIGGNIHSHPSTFSGFDKFLTTRLIKGLTGFLGVLEPSPTHVLFSG